LRRRGCGCLRCNNSNCCRKHRPSATGSALGPRAAERAQTGKPTTPVRNGLIWCAISGRGPWLFRLSRAKHWWLVFVWLDLRLFALLSHAIVRILSKVPLISLLNGRRCHASAVTKSGALGTPSCGCVTDQPRSPLSRRPIEFEHTERIQRRVPVRGSFGRGFCDGSESEIG
jgi:hypothetical protein